MRNVLNRWCGSIGIAAALTLPMPPAFAADDAYLNALENEAAGLSVDPATQQSAGDTAAPTGSSSGGEGIDWDARRQGLGEQLPAGLDRPAFEEALQLNYVGSYVFYQSLPEASKTAVFEVYRNSADMVAVRAKIQSELKAK